MNTQKAKTVHIKDVLDKMEIYPQKTNGLDIWYFSPFTIEKTPSFKVNLKINRWYCHSSGYGGNTLDFVIKKLGCSISEALTYLSDFNFSFSFQKQILNPSSTNNKQNNIIINKTLTVQHIALKQYLVGRCITKPAVQNLINEVHYEINKKKYFAIGFKNRSNGWELRSKYAKICLGKKDITLINNQNTVLRIFEGFFDYLSFLQIENEPKETSDYLILNSAALIIKNIGLLDYYKKIELYLDNDETGEKYSNFITCKYNNAIDFRWMYKESKDLNQWLISSYSML